jgi:CBS domain-containing protein
MTLDIVAANTRVRELMTVDVVTVASHTPLFAALELMVEKNIGSVVVVSSDQIPFRRRDLRGVVPVFFALREFVRKGKDVTVEAAILSHFVTANANETVADILPRIVDNKTWRMIVLENDVVVGVLSATDILNLFRNSISGDNYA